MHDQHWHARAVNDSDRHAAKDGAGERAVSTGSDDDQVGADLFGEVGDLPGIDSVP